MFYSQLKGDGSIVLSVSLLSPHQTTQSTLNCLQATFLFQLINTHYNIQYHKYPIIVQYEWTLSIYLFIYVSIYLPIYPSTYLLRYGCVHSCANIYHLYICIFIFINKYVCVYACLCVCAHIFKRVISHSKLKRKDS